MKRNLYSFLLLAFVFVCSVNGNAQIITTVAGNGTDGYSGDGGAATAAEILYPTNMAAGGSGNVYISGGGDNRVRKVSVSGIISTFAGTGSSGYSGDGGPATAAQVNIGGLATDALGNVYISDGVTYRIRKVNTSGIITTIAGNGTWGYTGDGGPATAAEIKNEGFLASDPYGNVYFYNWDTYHLRKIDTSGIITTIAGDGTEGYSGDGGPATAAALGAIYGLAADGIGNVYLADVLYHRVRVINSSGIIFTIAGDGTAGFAGDGGQATAAEIMPAGISIDNAGNLNIGDYGNNRVRKVSTSGVITTIAGTGEPINLSNPVQFSSNDYYWVNSTTSSTSWAPMDALTCHYANSVSGTPNFQAGGLAVYAWALNNSGSYEVHYKFPTSTPYAFRHSTPSQVPTSKAEAWVVYPNPANDELVVSYRNTSSAATGYRITDMAGRVLLNGAMPGSAVTIDVSALAAGAYLFQLYNDDALYGEKLFVKN